MSRGGLREVISTLSLCAALVITIQFTVPLTEFMTKSPLISDVVTSAFFQNFMKSVDMPPLTAAMLFHISYCVALLICFVGTFSVCEGVLAYSGMMESFSLPTAIMNRKAGAASGAMRGFVLVLIFIIILDHLFIANGSGSTFINLLHGSARKMDALISARAPERYQEILQDRNLYNQTNVINDLTKPR